MKNINVAKLLRNCPKGMELDCTICNGVKFIELDSNPNFPIRLRANNGYEFYLTKYGQVHNIEDAKCVIFPKGKTTWEGFQRPFKDGDIIATDLGSVFILNSCLEDEIHYHSYIGVTCCNEIQEKQIPFAYKCVCHLATEEEKQKLFQVIKDNGYKWNEETKTLEKLIEPKFKVGDRIKYKRGIFRNERTITSYDKSRYWTSINDWIDIARQDDWELVPNKFDINTLKPFKSRVLVRGDKHSHWKPSIFGCYIKGMNVPFYVLGGTCWNYCIPYEGNEHLLGTTDDCEEYFKT